MKPKTYRYGSILLLSTLQFEGHFSEYFVKNAKKVVAFYILPRNDSIKNFIEFYEYGKLTHKKSFPTPKNIILSYVQLYLDYITILLMYFKKDEPIYFINFLPVFFFFHSIIRLFRDVRIVFWVGDYWPMNSFYINIYRWFMHYFHEKTKDTIYLTDRINKKMNNGKIMSEWNKKTVMWGIKPYPINLKRKITDEITLCFIGVLVESQGLNLLFSVVGMNSHLKLKIIGTGEKKFVETCQTTIKKKRIGNRVYFPNKFVYGQELKKEVNDCHIGVALYTVDKNSVTYWKDPAKVKQYTEFGLPVLMTRSSEIADYIARFHAGEIVDPTVQSVNHALQKMSKNYTKYLLGVKMFNEYFNYTTYYKKTFKFLET